MFCSYCGAQSLSDQDRFCGSCGKPLASAAGPPPQAPYGAPVQQAYYPPQAPTARRGGCAGRIALSIFSMAFLMIAMTARRWVPMVIEFAQSLISQLQQ